MPEEIPVEMDAEDIVVALSGIGGFPYEAIAEAERRRAELLPLFRRELERFVAPVEGDEGDDRPDDSADVAELEDDELDELPDDEFVGDEAGPVALIFHLLARWRERSAYRLMTQVLRGDPELVELEFGDMRMLTVSRALAAVFDGDLAPICDTILDPDADAWVRSAACEAFVPLVANGLVSRDQVIEALKSVHDRIRPHEEHPVWLGWMETVSGLAIDELKGRALAAIRHGWVDPSLCEAEDFNTDFARAARAPGRIDPNEVRTSLFHDVEEELAEYFEPEDESEDDETDGARPLGDGTPAVNPFRHVGRNDPCPCGSGKKFKKCCGA